MSHVEDLRHGKRRKLANDKPVDTDCIKSRVVSLAGCNNTTPNRVMATYDRSSTNKINVN